MGVAVRSVSRINFCFRLFAHGLKRLAVTERSDGLFYWARHIIPRPRTARTTTTEENTHMRNTPHESLNPNNEFQYIVFIAGSGQYAVVIGKQHYGRFGTLNEAKAVRDSVLNAPAPLTPDLYFNREEYAR
jgi:hypothetical protein